MEAIRTLMVARRSAAGERTRTINQARALVLTGPDDLRARFARHKPAALITGLAALRPRTGDVAGHATGIALRELGRRARFPDAQLERLDELIVPLVTARAPGLLAVYGPARALRRCCSSRREIIPVFRDALVGHVGVTLGGHDGDGKGPADGAGGAWWCPGCRGGGRVVLVSGWRV